MDGADWILPLSVALTAMTAGALGWLAGRRRWPAVRGNGRARPLDGDLTTTILDAAVDGIVVIDVMGTIRSFNPAAERIFGFDAAEVVGRNVGILMPEPDRSAHHRYMRHYLETGDSRIIGKSREVEGLRKDGRLFPMELAVGGATVDGERLFAGIIRDLSQRRETEGRLRFIEARNRAIVEAAVDGIITIDEQGRIESFNRGAERIFGYAAGEVLGRNINILMPEPYRSAHDTYLRNYLTTGQARIIGIGREVQGLRRDGSVFPMDLAVGEGFFAGRRIFAGTVRDITARKQAEEALRRAKEEAERASLAKTRFLAAASHDLRQPVQSLVFFAAALEAELPEGKARALMAEMMVAFDGLRSLLDSLLDISRLDAGMVTPKPVAVALDPLLTTVRGSFGPAAAAKGIDLRVVGSTAVVRSDPVLLARLIQNLVDNAVRYTEHGRILVGVRRSGSTLRLEVWDTGIGIPEAQTTEIFEEFVQLANPERDRAKGLGLGLAIVRRLSELLGHRVRVRSTPGRGSLFWVELPRTIAASAQDQPAPRPVPLDGARRGTILLIDDEAMVLLGLGALLRSWGFEVIAAASADEAVALLADGKRTPTLILADYRLREGRTGTEAIRTLCELYHRAIPAIILTGDTAPERLREAEASGHSILHKPVAPPALLTALTRTMGSA